MAYMLSDEYARVAETPHETMGTHKPRFATPRANAFLTTSLPKTES